MKPWPVLALLAACGHVNYKDAPVGRIDGSAILMWVDETHHAAGDGTFVFVPNKDPLVFRPGKGSAWTQPIRPEIMYTDGGSIPAVAQALPGLSPWGYAPAYMVHDWLFVARKCLTDGQASDAEKVVDGKKFQASADIMAELVRTMFSQGMVVRNDVAGQAIASAVAGPISERLWTARGACAAQRIKPAHLAQIKRALPGIYGRLATLSNVKPATIVAVFSSGSP